MNEMVALRGVDPREILQTAVDKKVPAIMSYLSKGKWHVAKVLLTELGADRFSIESTHIEKKPHPINVQMDQPVGISFKYEYGKFVFDTTVVDLGPSSDSTSIGRGGTIILAVPDRIEVVQRRSYFRVNVPESLKVNVMLWHRSQTSASSVEPLVSAKAQAGAGKDLPERQTPTLSETSHIHKYYQGRLADISAGGAQIIIDAEPRPVGVSPAQEPEFKKGQFVGLRFTPLPYEMPLMFNAQIRNILPTADNKSIYLGLQIVGLESSREGRQVLSRIVGVVERYYRMNPVRKEIRSANGMNQSATTQPALAET
jgi:hypothetical protein